MSSTAATRFKVAYVGSRPDLAALVPPNAQRILDVGCATGALGAALKATRPEAQVIGVELDPEMAKLAEGRLDRVLVEPIEDALRGVLADWRFDCVVCGDVLEHLTDPWATLRGLAGLLAGGGCVVASLPNVAHLDTFVNLLRRRWPYRTRGIHDSTHLRFFALANVRGLFAQAGLEIVELRRHYRIVERPHRLNRLAPFFALPGLRELVAFQYLVVARPGTPRPPRRFTVPGAS